MDGLWDYGAAMLRSDDSLIERMADGIDTVSVLNLICIFIPLHSPSNPAKTLLLYCYLHIFRQTFIFKVSSIAGNEKLQDCLLQVLNTKNRLIPD